MKLLISQMNEGDNPFEFSSQKDGWMRELVDRLAKENYTLDSELNLKMNLTKLEPDYVLRGQMDFKVHQSCARCAEEFPLPLKHNFDIALAHVTHGAPARTISRMTEESEALDVQFFEGNEIDLGPIIQEQFFLSIPYQAVCKEECKGMCPRCGKNLNEVATCGCVATNPLNPFSVLKDKVKKDQA